MASINPDRLSTLMQQLTSFDLEAGSLPQAPEAEKGSRLDHLRGLAASIQNALVESGIALDQREVTTVNTLMEGSSDSATINRVSSLFNETISRVVTKAFSLPLELAIREAIRTGDMSGVRQVAQQIKGSSMEINFCRFVRDASLLEYLFDEPLFGQKITPQLLKELLSLGINPNLFHESPPLATLLRGFLQGSFSQQETVNFIKELTDANVDMNITLPRSSLSIFFLLQDSIYGWSLEETPGLIEAIPKYMVTPELFEPIVDHLSLQHKSALLESFRSAERGDLVDLFKE